MKDIILATDWQKTLHNLKLPRWSELPDIPVYMDQLVTLVQRYTQPFSVSIDNQPLITSSMVNNYVKQKLILPPEKKKYDQRHLARLIIITTLKQSFDMTIVQQGIIQQIEASTNYEQAYDHFCQEMEDTVELFLINSTTDQIEVRIANPLYQPIQMATITLVAKLVTERTIQSINKTLKENEEK
ncbi:DUF1836 domain-containing protein [Vagococcus coleopterorum]|uniref:DUF1836 domain-containing protein n=1 Tax=Vagococcus coleopterorum TaxID=2714946 RepID=A0A6G8ALS3_9ENTE|nr:DUF1836 domain-containing protein [Vagococcus coleopterorum]QIL45873.1 DUF1836 domain-containing protein [Vagococcus coleopterorum]